MNDTETDFKKLKHQLPLARIKKIMKSDEDVRVSLAFHHSVSDDTLVWYGMI
jgi:hypothetical protein